MTVRELITELEAIKDKDLDVVIDSDDYGTVIVDYVTETEIYYGKVEENGYVCKTRKCVLLD